MMSTIVPIMLLILSGFLSRRFDFLRAGDERVFSAYVYYFALPSLFFVNMAEIRFSKEVLTFIFGAILPIAATIALFVIIKMLFRFSLRKLYLLLLSTIFGSTAFFGIPFVMIAFPSREAEHLAVLAAASISLISVPASITVLEFFKLGKIDFSKSIFMVFKKLSRNPLILSIFFGVIFSLAGIKLPPFLSNFFHMLGGTTAAVAIFMLGVFLYGRKYKKLLTGFGLSLLRIIALPILALGATSMVHLKTAEKVIIVLMHAMPVAISMIVLSQKYDFEKETFASLILISSLASIFYLNIWLFLLRMLFLR